jgi:hypothetical protein
MAKRVIDESSLTSVADAIRDKCETTSQLVFPDGFVSAIGSIVKGGGGITPVGTIQITQNGSYDVTTYASANVNVPTGSAEPVLQSKPVTPAANQKIVEPDPGYDGLSQVIVAGDSDLVAGNIKKNVNIFGVTGTYEGAGSSSDSEIEVDDLSGLHTWHKYSISGTHTVATEAKQLNIDIAKEGVGINGTVYYANDIVPNGSELSLMTPYNEIDLYTASSTEITKIRGKYINPAKIGGFYLVDDNAKVSVHKPNNAGIYHSIDIDLVFPVTYNTTSEFTGIVISENRNAYPDDGESNGCRYVYNGTIDDAGGVILPDLGKPAEHADIVYGMEVIGADGSIIKGSMQSLAFNGVTEVSEDAVIAENDDGSKTFYVIGKTINTKREYVDPATTVGVRMSDTHEKMSMFGNATAADVRAGKTFTSAAGLACEGTYAPVLETRFYIPVAAGDTIEPTKGYDGISKITIAGDDDLVPENIKAGVKIFKVTGTYTGDGGGTGADVTLANGVLTIR